jgi:carbonic anhydrase
MSLIDDVLEINAIGAKYYNPEKGKRPSPKLAIVTCMDPRLSGMLKKLGLEDGDAAVMRNAGSVVNENAIRSLVVSTRVLGAREIMIISHTDCGMQKFDEWQLHAELQNLTGATPDWPAKFHSFADLEVHTLEQVQVVKSHPWICRDVPVRGFIYDVETGKLRELKE